MNKLIAVLIIGLLIVSSILIVGYSRMGPEDDDKDKDQHDLPDDEPGTLPSEVTEKWMKYTNKVDSPDVITTDPNIVKTKPGEQLEWLAHLEGMNNFTDTSYGTSSGNYSGPPLGGQEPGVTGMEDDRDMNEDAKDAAGGDGSEDREVEEADLVKVIGDTLYVLNSYRGLITVDISDPADAHIDGQCNVIGYPKEMYVVDFLALITVQTDYNFWYRYWELDSDDVKDGGEDSLSEGTIGTMIYIVNVADPENPYILKIVELEGFPVESRRVGDVIYQATNTYNWYYYNNDDTETIVSSIDFGDPEKVGLVDQERFKGSSNQVHASSSAFYVAQPIWEYDEGWIAWDDYEYYTRVTYLDISDPDGEIKKRDTFKSPGYLEDKYQMDEYSDTFRMVTHFWTGIGESKLYIFDISNPDRIKQIGELLIDDAGSLMATRFAGERAYTIH
jgi:hypothetical protein